MTPTGPIEIRPPDTVVSFLLPETEFDAEVIQRFCHFVHFFASPEDGERWTAQHPGTFLLSVDDAYSLGQLTNRAAFGGKPTEPPSCADLVRRPESGACGQRHDSPSAGACRRACPRTESERAGIRVATLATLVLDVPTGARPGRISRSAGAGRSAGAALPADVDADGAACCPVWAL